MTAEDLDYQRRFGGIARLYGADALARFQGAHVCIIGIGGVGSWAAEAMARSAIGKLTLVDMDHIAVSNVNRQLPALDGNFGKAKVAAMAERVRAINPRCEITQLDDFLTIENLSQMMGAGYDYVLDCIDQMRVKVALVAHARRQGLPLIISGGAGGRIDPTRIQVADIALTSGDPLLARIRTELRRNHGFARDAKKFGIEAVFSTEPLQRPTAACATDDNTAVTGLNCAGYGSSVTVTAGFGMCMAGRVLARLATNAGRN